MSPEDRQATMREAQELLERGVESIRTDAGFKAYLRAVSRFHRYSFGNTLMILMQHENATKVASYKTWQTLGRQVRKGEKGIRIYAPLAYSLQGEDETTGETLKVSHVRGFTLVPVFDISQTDGNELPTSPAQALAEHPDAEGLTEALTLAAQSLGFTVSYQEMEPSKGGHFSLEDSIVLASGRSNLQTAKTLIHEMAHGLLDVEALKHGLGDEYRAGAELVAESTAFVACAGLGLDTSQYSLGYVAGWGGTVEKIKFVADVIQKTAHQILDAIGEEEIAA
jgi:antirestriction protein ArdC